MIPVVDAGALVGGESAARRALCDAIGEACRGTGFFYVTGHGVPESLIAATYEQAARFHALPDDEKHRYHIAKSRNHRGYVPPGEEDYGDEPGAGRKESFDLAADLPADDPDFVAGYRFLGPNVWPNLSGFREIVAGYYEAVMALGRGLLPAFALALGLPEDAFAPMFTKPTSNLRLLHYPAPEPGHRSDRLRLGIGSHTDSECFTILHQTKPGLQVMSVDGRWIDVTPLPGSFVVNVGDTLETWTNGSSRRARTASSASTRSATRCRSSSPPTSMPGSSRFRPSSRPSGLHATAASAPASTSSRSTPRASVTCGSCTARARSRSRPRPAKPASTCANRRPPECVNAPRERRRRMRSGTL